MSPPPKGALNPRATSELAQALSACRNAFVAVAALSGTLNVLMLTGSFFMLLVYDRVIPGHSVPTLVGLVLLVGMLFAFQAVLEVLRSRVLIRVGASIDVRLSDRTYATLSRLALSGRLGGDGAQAIRDLDQIRGFMSSAGPSTFFDLPWMLLYLGICFLFHVLIGVTALAGAIILIGMTFLTETLSRRPIAEVTKLASVRNSLVNNELRNAEIIQALGMRDRFEARWRMIGREYLQTQQSAADVTGGFGAVTRAIRMMLQSGVLAVGAYLVIEQKATGGVIIASSILTARALAPVELAIANWKGFISTRQSWSRLSKLFEALPVYAAPMTLPTPKEMLLVEGLAVAPPGSDRLAVADVSFALPKGHALGVIGPSASGKSSLVRTLVGVWKPARGAVRLDGASLDQWDGDALGAQLGYLPQDVELIAGTIAQNIARFEPNAPSELVIAAARQADVHTLITKMTNGYDTQVGLGGAFLSAGQRQRVALARALYRDPFLVVLDEPNSNLDNEGEQALSGAIDAVKRRSGIVVIVAHRPSMLPVLDLLLVMREGRMQAFGPKDEVLARMTPQAGPPSRPTLRGQA